MDVEVVYEGVLELGFNPESTTSRDWKPRLFVLKHDPKTKRSTLDFYKDTKKRWQKQVAKGLISLWPSFRLSLAHGSSYKFPIKLITSDGQTFCLAAQDFQTMNTWFTHIQTQLTLDNLFPDKKGCREYKVQVVETDSAKLIGARGDCLLVLSKGHFYLALVSSHKVVGVWPYNSLRRYYCIEETFGFVAGRRSPRGEGEFKFITSQKEDIYHRLERAILRAKRGSEGSTSSAEASKDVDSRPPAPLPSGQEPQSPHQETPVPTSESDEDIFQSDPDPRSISPSVRNMKQVMSEPFSDIHPAYGKFNSDGSRSGERTGRAQPTWLHESVSVVPQPQESSKKRYHQSSEVTSKCPPLPPSRNSQISMVPVASEEDTYSHTVHRVPEQFQKTTMEHNIIGGNVYNALVHQNSQQSLHGRNSRPSSEADMNLYDVAFPEGRKVISSGDYAVARHPDVPQYPAGATKLPPRRTVLHPGRDVTDGGTQSQEAKKPPASSPPPPTAAPSVAKGERKKSDDDGLTPNPLYGSQDKLLSDIAILDELTREMELGSSSIPEVCDRPTSAGAAAPFAPLSELMNLDEADQQFTMNPVYGEMTAEQKRRLMQDRASLVAHPEGNVTNSREEERERKTEVSSKEETPQPVDNSLLCESEQSLAQGSVQGSATTTSEQASQAEAASSDDGIQRDAKGYSKVDKSKKVSSATCGGGEGEPESCKDDVEDGGGFATTIPNLESQDSGEEADGSPPPLPERNYSFDESELNKPPIAGGGRDHES